MRLKTIVTTLIISLFMAFEAVSPAMSKPVIDRKICFDAGWKFHLGDQSLASSSAYNDGSWRTVTLPHDWSIELRPDKNAPAGNDGGYYPTGIAWYRKAFKVPTSMKGEKVWLYFEGIYMNSTVYLNGKQVGGHPYGYTSFFCDATEAIKAGKQNVVAVRVDNSQQKNCRWYSGSGIYRHVWLIHTPLLHIANHGVHVATPHVAKDKATVVVTTTVQNEAAQARQLSVTTRVSDREAVSTHVFMQAGETRDIEQQIEIHRPKLWDLATPHLYTADVTVESDGKVIDEVSQSFGIRTLKFSTDGFFLNGRAIAINGGCVHHDNGILGAAAFDRAEERKVRLMKDAGFNAIRTSHNPPSEAFLNACDRLGMLVIDEAFDGWRDEKLPHDYSRLFDQWWQKDIEAMVLRDRNHPSIIAWSIGNEVIERKKIEVVTTAHKLSAEVHKYDDRPVTSALASWDKDWEIYDPLAAQLDVVGYNYLIDKHADDHHRVPDRIMWQTESYPREAFHSWVTVHDHQYVIGDFVWTGIDYLGESGIGRYWYEGETPGEHFQNPLWPCHASYCGDMDLTGWRKPVSHYRDMLWNDKEKLYMAVKEPDGYAGKIHLGLWAVWPTWESWTWPGHEGKPIEVEVYSRYPLVRLYLNDQLVGEKQVGRNTEMKASFTLNYLAGTLRAEGIKDGKTMESCRLKTAGNPAAIRLRVENKTMEAGMEDLSFVQVEIVDQDGNLCPNAAVTLTAMVSGNATIAAFGNGDFKDVTPYMGCEHKTWKGRALIVLRSTKKSGKANLTVKSNGLKTAKASVTVN